MGNQSRNFGSHIVIGADHESLRITSDFMNEPKLFDGMRILLTGGSGWLGQETLCLLAKLQGSHFDLSITVLTGSGTVFEVHEKKYFPQQFKDIQYEDEFDLIIHLAFILPTRIGLLSQESYRALNHEITEKMTSVVQRNPKALKLIVSSGAATLKYGRYVDPNIVLYGHLKQEMEEMLYDENTLILRIWSTTGHHIPPHSKYALTNFLVDASGHRNIVIQNDVMRSYVSAQDIIRASLFHLIRGGRGIVNSGGDRINLTTLARTIVEVFNSNSSIKVLNSNIDAELNYVSPPCEIPNEFTSSFLALKNQVVDLRNSFIASHQ